MVARASVGPTSAEEEAVYCSRCGLRQPTDHRFCVACGTRVPRELLRRTGPKITRWFWGLPVVPADPADGALRVSRYVESVDVRTEDGTARVPSHHVRFSIWHGDRAAAAVSIPDDEAESLAEFLLAAVNGERLPEGSPAG